MNLTHYQTQSAFECKICFNYYQNADNLIPLILEACGHTFCKGCLTKVQSKQTPDEIKCPLCKVVTKKAVEKLKKNHSLIQVLESKESIRFVDLRKNIKCSTHVNTMAEFLSFDSRTFQCKQCHQEVEKQNKDAASQSPDKVSKQMAKSKRVKQLLDSGKKICYEDKNNKALAQIDSFLEQTDQQVDQVLSRYKQLRDESDINLKHIQEQQTFIDYKCLGHDQLLQKLLKAMKIQIQEQHKSVKEPIIMECKTLKESLEDFKEYFENSRVANIKQYQQFQRYVEQMLNLAKADPLTLIQNIEGSIISFKASISKDNSEDCLVRNQDVLDSLNRIDKNIQEDLTKQLKQIDVNLEEKLKMMIQMAYNNYLESMKDAITKQTDFVKNEFSRIRKLVSQEQKSPNLIGLNCGQISKQNLKKRDQKQIQKMNQQSKKEKLQQQEQQQEIGCCKEETKNQALEKANQKRKANNKPSNYYSNLLGKRNNQTKTPSLSQLQQETTLKNIDGEPIKEENHERGLNDDTNLVFPNQSTMDQTQNQVQYENKTPKALPKSQQRLALGSSSQHRFKHSNSSKKVDSLKKNELKEVNSPNQLSTMSKSSKKLLNSPTKKINLEASVDLDLMSSPSVFSHYGQAGKVACMLTSQCAFTYDFDMKVWDEFELVANGFEVQPDMINLINGGQQCCQIPNTCYYLLTGVTQQVILVDFQMDMKKVVITLLKCKVKQIRLHHQMVYTNQRIYILGGENGQGMKLNSCEYFELPENISSPSDFDKMISKPLAKMIQPRSKFGASVTQESLYVFGGEEDNQFRTFERYSFFYQTWEKIQITLKVKKMPLFQSLKSLTLENNDYKDGFLILGTPKGVDILSQQSQEKNLLMKLTIDRLSNTCELTRCCTTNQFREVNSNLFLVDQSLYIFGGSNQFNCERIHNVNSSKLSFRCFNQYKSITQNKFSLLPGFLVDKSFT